MTDKPDNESIDNPDLELRDVVLNTENDDPVLQPHPIPAGIKYGLPVFVLVIALSGFFVYQAFTDSRAEEELVFEPEEITDIARQKPPPRLPLPVFGNELVDKASIDSLKTEVQALEKTVFESASLVSKQHETFNLQNNRIQQAMESLEQNQVLLVELTSAIKDVSVRLEGLEGSVGNNTQQINQLTRQSKRQPRARPAFNLLSIDQWGGRDSVVLELQNSTTMAAVGDIRAGWTIRSIDRPNCIDVVRVSDKAKARVCRKSNS